MIEDESRQYQLVLLTTRKKLIDIAFSWVPTLACCFLLYYLLIIVDQPVKTCFNLHLKILNSPFVVLLVSYRRRTYPRQEM